MDKYFSPCYGYQDSTPKTIWNSPNDSGYLSSPGDFGSGCILRHLKVNRDSPGCKRVGTSCCSRSSTLSKELAEEIDESHGWHGEIQCSETKLLAASCKKDEMLISEVGLNPICTLHEKLQFSAQDTKALTEHSYVKSEILPNMSDSTKYLHNTVTSERLVTDVCSGKDPMYASSIISKGSSLRCCNLGQPRVDILGALANYRPVVSYILQFLGPEDLVAVATVSHKWRSLCRSDKKANHRRQAYLHKKMQLKENEDKSPYIQAQEHSRKYLRRGPCSELQNLRVPSPRKKELASPPVSPSKVRFHLFYKEGGKLSQGEYLMPCPRCSLPSHTSSSDGYGRCSRPGCLFEFCVQCRCAAHKGTPCRTSLPTLQNHCKRTRNIIGSAASRRNLRKLLL